MVTESMTLSPIGARAPEIRALGGSPTVRCRSEPPRSSMVRRRASMAAISGGNLYAKHAVVDASPGDFGADLFLLPQGENHIVHETHPVFQAGLHRVFEAL